MASVSALALMLLKNPLPTNASSRTDSDVPPSAICGGAHEFAFPRDSDAEVRPSVPNLGDLASSRVAPLQPQLRRRGIQGHCGEEQSAATSPASTTLPGVPDGGSSSSDCSPATRCDDAVDATVAATEHTSPADFTDEFKLRLLLDACQEAQPTRIGLLEQRVKRLFEAHDRDVAELQRKNQDLEKKLQAQVDYSAILQKKNTLLQERLKVQTEVHALLNKESEVLREQIGALRKELLPGTQVHDESHWAQIHEHELVRQALDKLQAEHSVGGVHASAPAGKPRRVGAPRFEGRGDKLSAALVKVRGNDVKQRIAAAIALGALGGLSSTAGAEARHALVAALRGDRSWIVRMLATISLGELPDASLVQPLIKALREDASCAVRGEAAKSLGLVGDTSALDALTDAMRNGARDDVRAAAAGALLALRVEEPTADEARRVALRVLQSGANPMHREIAAWAVGRAGGEEARAELMLAAICDSRFEARVAARNALEAMLP